MTTASGLGLALPSLKSLHLRRLSFLCGLPLSGRKTELAARLLAAAGTAPLPSPAPVVLSIDLGLRNLAFSLLNPVSLSASLSKRTTAKSKGGNGAGAGDGNQSLSTSHTSPPPVTLHAWQRLSLLHGLSLLKAESADTQHNTADSDTAKDQFSPEALAKVANTFLQETMLQFEPLPTHILIERQRWRSGGSVAIQEWTLRVNTLEAMLHASLRTLRDVGVWKGEVISVQPQRVAQLFLGAEYSIESPSRAAPVQDEEAEVDDVSSTGKSGKGRTSAARKTSAEAKKQKIELLNGWLAQKDLVIQPGNAAMDHMLSAYKNASKRSGRSSGSRTVAVGDGVQGEFPDLDKKLDDITDSLMQGMAWLRWQDNLTLLRSERGVEQLLAS
ncbi:mitochondrial resolvase Ydc2 [Astrocystis sublimbata]|nr:mitochondrial resolvase Ydc2 [Astrocystis sublimbata]